MGNDNVVAALKPPRAYALGYAHVALPGLKFKPINFYATVSKITVLHSVLLGGCRYKYLVAHGRPIVLRYFSYDVLNK